MRNGVFRMFPENKRLVDISNETGVSIATVSRYLNNKRIRPELKARLDSFMSENGYSSPGESLSSRQKIIGLLVPDCFSRSFSFISDGVVAEARKDNYVVIPVYAQGDLAIEDYLLKAFKQMGISGLIYFPISSDEEYLQKRLAPFRNIPTVIAWRRLTGRDLSHVYSDNIGACYKATKYLLRQTAFRIFLKI